MYFRNLNASHFSWATVRFFQANWKPSFFILLWDPSIHSSIHPAGQTQVRNMGAEQWCTVVFPEPVALLQSLDRTLLAYYPCKSHFRGDKEDCTPSCIQSTEIDKQNSWWARVGAGKAPAVSLSGMAGLSTCSLPMLEGVVRFGG